MTQADKIYENVDNNIEMIEIMKEDFSDRFGAMISNLRWDVWSDRHRQASLYMRRELDEFLRCYDSKKENTRLRFNQYRKLLNIPPK